MLEKIKRLGLKWKSGIVVFIALLIVIFILLVILQNALNDEFEALYGDPSRRGLSVAKLLADELRPILERDDIDLLTVQQEIQQTVDAYIKAFHSIYSVRYILIQDGSGSVIVDTFKEMAPQSLVEINPPSEERRCKSFPVKGGNRYVDCAEPLQLIDKTTGEKSIGSIRIGLLEPNPQSPIWQKLKTEHVKGIFNPILGFSLLFIFLVTLLLTLAFWYFVIRRIVFLSEATERMSFGDLETVVPIKSQDEIGTLEDTLNRMRANLKDAIERLKRRK